MQSLGSHTRPKYFNSPREVSKFNYLKKIHLNVTSLNRTIGCGYRATDKW